MRIDDEWEKLYGAIPNMPHAREHDKDYFDYADAIIEAARATLPLWEDQGVAFGDPMDNLAAAIKAYDTWRAEFTDETKRDE